MANKNITVMLDMLMNTSNVNSGIGQIRQQLKTLKLPSNLQDSFRKSFSDLDDGVSKIQRRLNSGFKTKSDVTCLEKELKNVDDIITNIIKDYNKIGESTINKSLKLENLDEFKELQILLADINKELSAQKETTAFKKVTKDIQELNKITKANALKQFTQAIDTGNIEEASKALEILKQRVVDPTSQKLYFGNSEKQREYNQLVTQLEQSFNALSTGEIQSISKRLGEINNRLDNVKSKAFNELSRDIQTSRDALDELQVEFRQAGAAEVSFASDTQRITTEMDKLNSQVEAFFGVSNYIQLFKRAIHAAYKSVEELDKAMTETAVVTDFSVNDMWNELPRYTEAANKLGTTTLGAYETMTLFYQQGLKTNEVFEIGTETMKMARIAGMDYIKATDLMTAALRGFNMELNETSATRINDVYSKLAAITAADTEEIADAMTRTASIANSAGMEFETTSAFLSQMIETTREAPENLGTAMKTIVARFQELKKAPSEIASEIDGEALDVNKIDTALKSIGVSLMDNVTGQFRDLDDVFLEIASKWNSLDKNTQRYIATIAAGSRQQSRFIAMMSDYERTMELVDAANNSAGASQLQFEKTTESLESKVNKLKNAVNEFVMGIANNQIIKLAVDGLTNLLTAVNNLSNAFGSGIGGAVKLGIAIAGLKGAKGILEKTIGFISKSWTGVDKNTDKVRTLGDAFLTLKAKGEKGKKGILTVTNAFKDFYNDLAKGVIKKIDLSEIGQSLMKDIELIDPENALSIQNLAKQYKISETQVKAFNDAISLGTSVEQASILLKNESAAASFLEAKANKENVEAILEETAAKSNNNKQTQLSIGTKTAEYAKLLFGKKATRAAAAEQLGLATATTAAAAGAEGATVATSGLGAALMSLPVGWIVAGIAAITASLVLLYKWAYNNSIKGQIEQTSNALADVQDNISATKSSLEELKNSQDKLSELEESFNGLVKGTDAWNQKLLESNALISELISKYPSLKLSENNGRLTIDTEEFEKLINEQNEILKTQNNLGLALSAQKNYLQEQQKYTDLLVDISENRPSEELKPLYTAIDALTIAERFINHATSVGGIYDFLIKKAEGESINTTIKVKLEENVSDEAKLAKQNLDVYKRQQIDNIKEILKGNIDNQNLTDEQINSIAAISAENFDKIQEQYKNSSFPLLDGATRDQIKEWARMLNIDDYDISFTGQEVTYTDLSGKEKTITNEEVATQLTTLKTLDAISNNANNLIESLTNINKGVLAELEKSETVTDASNDLISSILNKSDLIDSNIINQLVENEDAINDSLNNYLNTLSQEEQARIISDVLGESYDDVYDDIDTYTQKLSDLLKDNVKDIADAQKTRNKKIYTIIAKSLKINQEDLNKDLNNDYINYIDGFVNQLTESQKLLFTQLSDSIETNLSSDALSAFTTELMGAELAGGPEAISDILDSLQNIDLSNPIEAFSILSTNAKSANIYISGISQELLNTSQEVLSMSSQVKYFYSSLSEEISKEFTDLISKNGQITGENILELSKQNETLAKLLDNTEISVSALADAFTRLQKGEINPNNITEGGLRALSAMKQLDGIVESAFDTIDNFKPERDTGEIADYFNDIAKTAIEMYENGEYGNAQLISYLKLFFGEDEWNKALTAANGNLKEVEKNYISKLKEIENNLYGSWKDIATNYQNKIANFNKENNKKLNIGLNGAGLEIQVGDMTSRELTNAIAEIYGVSKQYAEALIADLKSNSYNFAEAIGINDALAGLEEYKKASTYDLANLNNVTIYSSEDIMNTAGLLGISYEEYLVMLGQMEDATVKTAEDAKKAFQKNKIGFVDIFDKDFNKDYDDIVKEIVKATSKGSADAGETVTENLKILSESFIKEGTFIIDDFQDMMSKLGIPEETINKMLSGIAEKLDDNTSMTINGVEIDKAELAEEGVDATKLFEKTLEEHNWEKVGEAILNGIVNGIVNGIAQTKDNIVDSIKSAIGLGGQKGAEKAAGYITGLGKLNPVISVGFKYKNINGKPPFIGSKYSIFPENPFDKAIEEKNKDNENETNNNNNNNNNNTGSTTIFGYENGSGKSDSGSSSSRQANTINDKSEPYDKLYNILRRIDKELRMINKYQDRYNRLLETTNVSGEDLNKNLQKQINYYNKLIANSQKVIKSRKAETALLENKKITYTYTYQKDSGSNAKGDQKLKQSKYKLSHYVKYDDKNNIVSINNKSLDKLANSRDPNTQALYKEIQDYISQFESYQDDIEEAFDNIEDAKNSLKEIAEKGRETYRDLEDRIYEALVKREQEKIDKLSQIDNSINNANSELLDEIQNSISKTRQERENKKTEEDIAKKERRLAYLRRDTSNANALEIKKLEEELANQKEDYTDTLIDQKINELQEQNDEAAQQRQQQIDLLQAQLDYDEKSGYFWEEAHRLIKEGTDETGKLIHSSELVDILKEEENWSGLSAIGQMDWYQELNSMVAEAWNFLQNFMNTSLGAINTLLYAVQTGQVNIGDTISFNKTQGISGKGGTFNGTIMDNGMVYYEGSKKDSVHFEFKQDDLSKNSDGSWSLKEGVSLDESRRFDTKNEASGKTAKTQTIYGKKSGSTNELVKMTATRQPDGTLTTSNGKNYPYVIKGQDGRFYTPAAIEMIKQNKKKFPGILPKYKKGGLADFTGPAWLDGTKAKPELVLNQRDTENFIQLKDILRSLLNNNQFNNSGNGGDNIYEIHIEVDKLENDYDVEQVANKVKRMIVNDSQYRNVNAINRLR